MRVSTARGSLRDHGLGGGSPCSGLAVPTLRPAHAPAVGGESAFIWTRMGSWDVVPSRRCWTPGEPAGPTHSHSAGVTRWCPEGRPRGQRRARGGRSLALLGGLGSGAFSTEAEPGACHSPCSPPHLHGERSAGLSRVPRVPSLDPGRRDCVVCTASPRTFHAPPPSPVIAAADPSDCTLSAGPGGLSARTLKCDTSAYESSSETPTHFQPEHFPGAQGKVPSVA